jgi:AbrB family looped-hinge helix DNA binding protein
MAMILTLISPYFYCTVRLGQEVRMTRHFQLTVTSKGQVTLPAEYRRAVGIEAGTTLALTLEDDGEARLRKKRPLRELIGAYQHWGDSRHPITKADIRQAAMDAMGEKEKRSTGRKPR